MSEHIMPFDGNGQPDFLSIINSEAEKVEPSLLTRFHPISLPYKHQLLNFRSLCRLLLINPRKRRT